ncbi:hypothetical protein DMA11_22340 [Marinilabiliaceae bacterium JC017]|nr:hypothetical protein DMA11_22340 [Marinilabiliaceae bacterium JC017]
MTLYRLVLILIFSYSFCTAQNKNEKNNEEYPLYFPSENTKQSNTNFAHDVFLKKWFSKHLFAMEEPILYDKTGLQKEIYRITILRTFANPYTLRLEKGNNRIILYWKECDGSGGYEPGNLISDKKLELEMEDWKLFQEYVKTIDYWNIPSQDENSVPPPPDGTAGMIEGLSNERYHVIEIRYSEKFDTSPMLLFLVNMTDINYKSTRD